jgi:hypothetical protein
MPLRAFRPPYCVCRRASPTLHGSCGPSRFRLRARDLNVRFVCRRHLLHNRPIFRRTSVVASCVLSLFPSSASDTLVAVLLRACAAVVICLPDASCSRSRSRRRGMEGRCLFSICCTRHSRRPSLFPCCSLSALLVVLSPFALCAPLPSHGGWSLVIQCVTLSTCCGMTHREFRRGLDIHRVHECSCTLVPLRRTSTAIL